MIDSFVSRARHFRNGKFPHVSSTGNWQDVGHYTQVIWRNTREIGCAVARGGSNDFSSAAIGRRVISMASTVF